MQSLDDKRLVELLKSNPEISYIASAMTPWHAIGVVASVMSQRLERAKGIILINIHPTLGKTLISDNNFLSLKEYAEIYLYSRPSTFTKFLQLPRRLRFVVDADRLNRARKRELRIISPRHIDINLGAMLYYSIDRIKISMIFYDEGLATYFPSNKVEGRKSLLKFIYDNLQSALRKIYLWSHKTTNGCLFISCKHHIKINDSILPYYQDAIVADSGAIATGDLSLFEGSVIICPNAWRRNQVKDNADSAIVLKLIEYLDSKGAKYVIKLHPRDQWSEQLYSKFSDKIYNKSDVSMESILSSLDVKPSALVGFSSTVLVTSKLFWNILTINIADIVNNQSLGQMYWSEKYYFTKIFGEYVPSPKRLGELYKLL